MPGEKASITLKLPPSQWQWLDEMAANHSLSGGTSKAVRCCINCAALGDVEWSTAAAGTAADGTDQPIELANEQIQWLSKHGDNSSTVQSIVQACMGADEKTVFGVIRCKLKVAECEGAQEAVDKAKSKYGDGNVLVKEQIVLQ